jgi:hypothetical protein
VYVGVAKGDFLSVVIPADMARGLGLGQAAYACVAIVAIGLLTGDLWPKRSELSGIRFQHP